MRLFHYLACQGMLFAADASLPYATCGALYPIRAGIPDFVSAPPSGRDRNAVWQDPAVVAAERKRQADDLDRGVIGSAAGEHERCRERGRIGRTPRGDPLADVPPAAAILDRRA